MDDLGKSLEALYLKGDYQEAQKVLLAHKDQFEPGVFHYNLGTTLMKMGNFAAGRYHLEKALKNGYVDSKVIHNLSVAKGHLGVSDIESSKKPLDMLLSISLDVPFSLYLSLTLIFALLVLVLYKFKKIMKGYLVIAALVLSLIPVLYSLLFVGQYNYAVALSDTPLREGPSQIYGEISKVKAGSKFIVGEMQDGWYYIQSPNFLAGWVKKDDIAF